MHAGGVQLFSSIENLTRLLLRANQVCDCYAFQHVSGEFQHSAGFTWQSRYQQLDTRSFGSCVMSVLKMQCFYTMIGTEQ